MKRIVVAAVIALGFHGILFATKFPRLSTPPPKQTLPRVLSMRLMGTPHSPRKVLRTVKHQRSPLRPRNRKATTPHPKKTGRVMTKLKDHSSTKQKKNVPDSDASPEQNGTPQAAPDAVSLSKRVEEKPLPVEDSSQSGSVPGDSSAQLQEAMPLYRINRPPHYPPLAREEGIEGTVMLDVRVDTTGRVQEVHLAASSGSALLDQAALTAVEAWIFQPARKGAEPVEKWVRIPMRFQLQ
jgi:protein TonB